MATTEVRVPDIGNAQNVTVIEVMVSVGDSVNAEQSIVTLESDKASMEIPAPMAGQVEAIHLKVGDKVSEGDRILSLAVAESAATKTIESPASPAPVSPALDLKPASAPSSSLPMNQEPAFISSDAVHAGPAVRQLARELGVDLTQVRATGPKNRILKEDLQNYVKSKIASASSGVAIPTQPLIDFSKFGPIETQALNKIKRLTGVNLHRNWISIPHVTQFDEADITALEAFRHAQKEKAEKQGVKLTLLVFVMKAVVGALKQFPTFNASLDPNGEQLILKKYFHIGVAVDTPNGLVVPVIRDVDQKGLMTLAKELAAISQKAREKGLTPSEMSGSCFTISSLGGIGGTAFTPIVNAPDVAILGLSKSSLKPCYQDGVFVPRLMLPLSLSYDHRVIDGAEGARFSQYLVKALSDIRELLL